MEMDIKIVPLTKALIDDYLYFFDNIAFADHPDWSQCYCMHFHFEPAWDENPEKSFRVYAIDYIQNERLHGYLAYADGAVVGWCCADDKQNYAELVRRNALWGEQQDAKVKSVVCFFVAPKLRGKGIATKLLERVCADAVADGYDFLEGYPPSGECDMYAAHHGTVALFEKCGFSVYKRFTGDCMMRKHLTGGR